MSEELLGFKRTDAILTTYKNKTATYSIDYSLCFPVVEKKEHDNKVEDMRNTIELQKCLKTLFERKAIKLEQRLASELILTDKFRQSFSKEVDLTVSLKEQLKEKDCLLLLSVSEREIRLQNQLAEKQHVIDNMIDRKNDVEFQQLEKRLAEKEKEINRLKNAYFSESTSHKEKLLQHEITEKDKQLLLAENREKELDRKLGRAEILIEEKDKQIADLQNEVAHLKFQWEKFSPKVEPEKEEKR